MLIEINDRLYNDFSVWADANGMSDTDKENYIIKAFKDKFMIDKYGDLNDKFKENEEPKKTKKRTVKKKEEEPVLETVSDIVSQDESINEPVVDVIQPSIEQPSKTTRKRVIKSK